MARDCDSCGLVARRQRAKGWACKICDKLTFTVLMDARLEWERILEAERTSKDSP